jgi:GTP-binding protein EngB required for normal cell division
MFSINWENIYQSRMNWAYRAEDIFLNSILSPELRDLVRQDKEKKVITSLIGRSQVGKTSLILDLLGIEETKRKELYTSLRCGSSIGKAATPTAILYTKSDNDFFSYKDHQLIKENITIDELTVLLRDLRLKVENHSYVSDEAVIIKVARNYFSNKSSDTDLTIIDLPGYGSSNPKEKQHVDNIIKKYKSISTLNLLIEKADNMNSLSKIFKEDEFRFNSELFRVVLTFSVTPASMMDNLLKEGVSRNKYEQIINNDFKRTFPTENIIVYPLEFGDSWNNMEDAPDQEQIKQKMNSILIEIKQDLKKDIVESSKKYNAIIQKSKLPNKIKTFKHKILSSCNEQKEEIQKKINKYNESLKRIKKLYPYFKNDTLSISENKIRMKLVKLREREKQISSLSINIHLDKFVPNKKTKKDFLNNIHNLKKYIEKTWIDLSKQVSLDTPIKIHLERFQPLESRINNYVASSYYPTVSNCWVNDLRWYNQIFHETINVLNHCLSKKKLQVILEITKEKDAIYQEKKILISFHLLTKSKGKLILRKRNIQYKNRLRILDIEKDIKISEKFIDFLEKEFTKEYNQNIKNCFEKMFAIKLL